MLRANGGLEGVTPDATTITLSTGVILRRKPPSSWALTEVVRQMAQEKPKPPMVNNPDRGRMEPNDADPDYQEALEAHETRTLERQYAVVVATGTTIEHVPDDVPEPTDNSWVEMLALLGIPCPADMSQMERYLRWVKYIAAPTNEDWLRLLYGLRRDVGTPEEDVALAAATFRSDEERPAD